MKAINTGKFAEIDKFRSLCIVNAEDSVRASKILMQNKINHIAFTLLVIALEEIGKIFIGWYQLASVDDGWEKERLNIPIDDHVKKLFWAIWGPSFGSEVISKENIDEMRGMANSLHQKRLSLMYTELSDEAPLASKVDNDEVLSFFTMVCARVELAKSEGPLVNELSDEQQSSIRWFMGASDDPAKRAFIFSNESQQKLIEFGNVREWILWLIEYFDKLNSELKALAEVEMARETASTANLVFVPKWKIRVKVVTPSHSIRANVLNSFENSVISLSKGGDNNTLLIDLTLGDEISINDLWSAGWLLTKTFVCALNVATNGVFYWGAVIKVDKYYETARDLKNKKYFELKIAGLNIDWSEKRMFLSTEGLALTNLVFNYFTAISCGSKAYEPINAYMAGLALLAKSDIHLRLEAQAFVEFYSSFKEALLINEANAAGKFVSDLGYEQLSGLLSQRSEYDRMLKVAEEFNPEYNGVRSSITLTHVIAMKQYAGMYLLTLAARNFYKDSSLKLVKSGQHLQDLMASR